MKKSPYFEQARWMLRVLSYVRDETCFALKGGTAINFFLRDAPRLSVDIDLAYAPLDSREIALKKISEALERMAEALKKKLPGVRIQPVRAIATPRRTTKLLVQTPGGLVKLEPNEVIRGSLYPSEERSLAPEAERLFELALTTPVLSQADLYGGKICAALDRQHPRDLFDIKVLLDSDGLPETIRKAFVVYLASHGRPMHELLDPTRKDIRKVFETDFVGMTLAPVSYDELVQAREVLIRKIQTDLTVQERGFLVSIKSLEPDWALLGVKGVDRLPAIQWKLQNIRKMEKGKRQKQLEALKTRLGLN